MCDRRFALLHPPAVVALVLLFAMAGSVSGQTVPPAESPSRTPWGDPDLQGMWDFRTVTPLERPEELADKEFLTDEEAVALRESELQSRNADRRGTSTASDLERGYNDFWWDYGSELTEDRRTSLIVDPPNGRMPPLTASETARARGPRRSPAKERIVLGVVPAGPEDIGLAERCLVGFNSGPPIMPSYYNNNVLVLQAPGQVVLHTEMIHETRVIPLDGRSHLPHHMRQWLGDSRGRWEGDTLVVETTNFTDKASFTGLPYQRGGSSKNMHLIERFTRVAPGRLVYEFTVTDLDAWTQPWTAVVPTSEALRHLVAVYGAIQIVIGTDYPFPWTATPDDARLPRFLAVDHVLGTPGLSDADRVAILGGNAANLFRIPAYW